MFKPLRIAFKLAPVWGNLLALFPGSNILVAVLQAATLIRQFFADGRPFDGLDDVIGGVIGSVPESIIERYGLEHYREGMLHIAKAMEAFHLGKEARK